MFPLFSLRKTDVRKASGELVGLGRHSRRGVCVEGRLATRQDGLCEVSQQLWKTGK